MPNNDTTTLDGSLLELGETMAANLTAKGVTSTASEGLTTLAAKILDIQGGGGVSCYKVEFTSNSLSYGDWDFANNQQVARLQIYLQYQYMPFAGDVTVSDGSNTYTVSTNAAGIGTLLAPITANTTTFTASYTATSDTFTVTKSTYLFKDSCADSSGLSSYASSVPLYKSTSGDPSCVLSYSSSYSCYEIHSTNSTTSYYSGIQINDANLNGETNYVATMEIYQIGSGTTNEVGLYVDNSNDTSSYGYGGTVLCQTSRLYGKRMQYGGVSTSNNVLIENPSLSRNTWYILELKVTDARLEVTLYDIDYNLIETFGYNQSINNKILMITQKGGGTSATSNLIRNIKVRSVS